MKRIGRYQFTKRLHRGGDATIHLAYDPVFECDVAVKVVKLDDLPYETKAFQREIEMEAKAIMSLKHAAILPLYNTHIKENKLYLVMPYLSGGSLAKRIEEQSLSRLQCIQLLKKLTPALALAHAQGVIHRNLKPTNVLFDEQGQPYLTDFGFACLQRDPDLFRATSLAYSSPEQAGHAHKIDQRSDIYALGVILFELLTQTLPYQANEPRTLAYKHLYNPIPTPSTWQTGLSSMYDQLIKKAIAKAPSARFNTIEEFDAGLDAIIADEEASKFYTSIPYVPLVERRLPQAVPTIDHNKPQKTRTPISYRPKKDTNNELNHSLLSRFLLELRRLFIVLRTWQGMATLSLVLTILVLLLFNIEYILGIIARSYFP